MGNLFTSPEAVTALAPGEWREFKITSVKDVSHDTKKFTVALPSPQHETGLVTASCLLVQGKSLDGSKMEVRPYTPTTLNSQRGYFELVIKKYPQGNVSTFMHNLSPGDSLSVKGPFMKLKIEPNMKKCMGMLAGGTGITPMYQCIQEILKNDTDHTKVSLLYVNRTPDDILLKAELDALAKKHSNFTVVYKVDQATAGWTGPVGHITPEDISSIMPPPSEDNMVLVCGPPGFMKFLSGDKLPDKSQGPLTGLLQSKGFTEGMVYKF